MRTLLLILFIALLSVGCEQSASPLPYGQTAPAGDPGGLLPGEGSSAEDYDALLATRQRLSEQLKITGQWRQQQIRVRSSFDNAVIEEKQRWLMIITVSARGIGALQYEVTLFAENNTAPGKRTALATQQSRLSADGMKQRFLFRSDKDLGFANNPPRNTRWPVRVVVRDRKGAFLTHREIILDPPTPRGLR